MTPASRASIEDAVILVKGLLFIVYCLFIVNTNVFINADSGQDLSTLGDDDMKVGDAVTYTWATKWQARFATICTWIFQREAADYRPLVDFHKLHAPASNFKVRRLRPTKKQSNNLFLHSYKKAFLTILSARPQLFLLTYLRQFHLRQ